MIAHPQKNVLEQEPASIDERARLCVDELNDLLNENDKELADLRSQHDQSAEQNRTDLDDGHSDLRGHLGNTVDDCNQTLDEIDGDLGENGQKCRDSHGKIGHTLLTLGAKQSQALSDQI